MSYEYSGFCENLVNSDDVSYRFCNDPYYRSNDVTNSETKLASFFIWLRVLRCLRVLRILRGFQVEIRVSRNGTRCMDLLYRPAHAFGTAFYL